MPARSQDTPDAGHLAERPHQASDDRSEVVVPGSGSRPRVDLPGENSATRPASVASPEFDLPENLRFELEEGRYHVRLARNESEVRAAQRVRFEVFNRELGEGLDCNTELGLDRDRFDANCHHVILIEVVTGRIVGTYRCQTAAMARAGQGFYCDGEYKLASLPEEVLERAVETGRACLLPEHRQGTGLFGLWRGLAAYLLAHNARYMFGCCSLTSQDPRDGLIANAWLEKRGKINTEVQVPVRASHRCEGAEPLPSEVANFKLPKLFGSYMRYGALSCSPPALDREFGTVDFLVLFDLERLEQKLYGLFFEF